VNLVIATGNLTRDPEMRYTNSGKAVTQFSIAINEGSGERRTTEYLDCVAWEKLAELVAEYTRKGRKVLVTGSLATEKWDDKKTGAKRSKTIVKCRSVEFLDRRPEDLVTQPEAPADVTDLADLSF